MLSNENIRIPFWKNAVGNIFVLACRHLIILLQGKMQLRVLYLLKTYENTKL
jgi:hypothetical protein